MDSSQLTIEQAKVMDERVRQMLGYLHALRSRIDKRGFPSADELRQKVERAHVALHSLSVTLHYMTCKSGVWQK